MTSEEKSKELVEKFMGVSHSTLAPICKKDAFQCAIICVNEILVYNYEYNAGRGNQYWKEVKEHLNKMV